MHAPTFDLLKPLGGEDAIRIYCEVALGVKPPADEPEEHARFRASVTTSVERARRRGWILAVPYD
jgi:hypothetical protein